jgi:hypothetical protein
MVTLRRLFFPTKSKVWHLALLYIANTYITVSRAHRSWLHYNDSTKPHRFVHFIWFDASYWYTKDMLDLLWRQSRHNIYILHNHTCSGCYLARLLPLQNTNLWSKHPKPYSLTGWSLIKPCRCRCCLRCHCHCCYHCQFDDPMVRCQVHVHMLN